MTALKVITTICPECDEVFRFIDGDLPLVKQCPHCLKKIEIKKVDHEEIES
jgi:hypothetical protein